MRAMKLSTKLAVGFGIIGVVLAAAVGLNQAVIRTVVSGINETLEEHIAIGNTAAEIELSLLQARRAEKDYLLRHDPRYAESQRKQVAAMKQLLAKLRSLGQRFAEEEPVAAADKIQQLLNRYAAGFDTVVTAWEAKGLDEKSGLQGKFRAAVHALEEHLKGHLVDDLYIDLLQVRREAGQLPAPVAHQARGRDDQVRRSHQNGAGAGQVGDRLQRLAQAHVVCEHPADAAVEQVAGPGAPRLLVRTQGGAHAGGGGFDLGAFGAAAATGRLRAAALDAHAALDRRYDELWNDDGGRDGGADNVRTVEQRMADAFVSLITGTRADESGDDRTRPPHRRPKPKTQRKPQPATARTSLRRRNPPRPRLLHCPMSRN